MNIFKQIKGEKEMLKIQEIREIIRLIDQSSISEFKYEHDDSRITIKKELKAAPQQVVNQEVVQQQPQQQAVAQPAQHQAPAEQPKQETTPLKEVPKQQATTEVVEDDDNIVEIVSPMVGTFYRKPSPESDPYVEVGDQIEEDTIVCIVEAMKLFNEIEAEVKGEIVEVLVEDATLVEYGQPLFKVKTN